jgi:glycine dehydrogenase
MSNFLKRHFGLDAKEEEAMLASFGNRNLDEFIDSVIPDNVKRQLPLNDFPPLSEQEALTKLRQYAAHNKVFKNFIGQGYYNTFTPSVILRNIFENPAWYTAYTPYQPEVAQGRLEALLNFQTICTELTGLPVANASLLDEGTAVAESVSMAYANSTKGVSDKVDRQTLFVSMNTFMQSIAVVRTRGEALGIEVQVGDLFSLSESDLASIFAIVLQTPDSLGNTPDFSSLIAKCKSAGTFVIVATDLLALTLMPLPSGVDIAVGSAQRFGVPLGYGGPHAAFLACTHDFKRLIPGRIVGVSRDSAGRRALRLSLQTREQHIRREKATSNICTAQVLLAVMAGMYAVYHGREGLQEIAKGVYGRCGHLANSLSRGGYKIVNETFFDTLTINPTLLDRDSSAYVINERATAAGYNFNYLPNGFIRLSVDELTTDEDLRNIAAIFKVPLVHATSINYPSRSAFMEQEVFKKYTSESEFLRYVKTLESKDLTLCNSMIPLGSCTMKLNATSEMIPVSWPEFSNLHPYAPRDQSLGYEMLFTDLKEWLKDITGLKAVSLQPNAGSQGEYAGLLSIRGYHLAQGEGHRNVCLIPKSAHGTNPASAVMAGMEVVVVECDMSGNVDLEDLSIKARQHAANLSCVMITYPSTHGVFEEGVRSLADTVHAHGGQVYLDGANFNALVGLIAPGELGVDVCHINLHKTFCIPHGGGGPGMGPIAVAKHLEPYLPGDLLGTGEIGLGPVSAAPYGSASILPISWMYMSMMGSFGLKRASQLAILSANYIAKELENDYPILYRGSGGVAHECIIDCRKFKASAGIEVSHIAKRLMDFGFHAPTVSWPVAGTMMIEPTESESKDEVDRFVASLRKIRSEIKLIEEGVYPRDNNPLVNAPHVISELISDTWDRPYSRSEAVYPLPFCEGKSYFAPVSAIDAAFGDRNLVCSCS